MAIKYVDETGFRYAIGKIDGKLDAKANLSDFNTLSEKVEGLVTAGGEPNLIEVVKVNNVALDIAEKAVNIDLSAYATTEALNQAIAGAVESVMHYRGTVAAFANLPTSGQVLGDVYNVTDTGANYAWNGTGWDELSGIVDLSAYSTTAQVESKIADAIADKATVTYVDGQIDAVETELAKKAVASEVTAALALKADASAVYTKTEVDNALADKANSADVYTKAQVDSAIDADVKVVSDALTTLDNSLAAVAKSGAYSDLTGVPTIDTALSETSTNAVENKAVYAALALKANTADFTAITNAEIDAMFA